MFERCTRPALGFAALLTLSTTTLSAAGGPPGDGPDNCLTLVIGTQSGTTVGFTDDSDEACPYAGSTSPDVYYCFTPTSSFPIYDLDLCESGYDTKIYVYDSDLELHEEPCHGWIFSGCSDDACSSSGGGAFRSFLDCVEFEPGETYYIVVDGSAGDAGPYTLAVTESDPFDNCITGDACWFFFPPCPPGATVESEPCAFGATSPNDLLNGGCNCTDPAGCFQPIECGETICGRTYFDGAFGDTDWFALDISAFGVMSLEITGWSEFTSVVGRWDNGGGTLTCAEATTFADMVVTGPCSPITLTTAPVTGTELWIYVGPDFKEMINCQGDPPSTCAGPDYIIAVECADACFSELDLDKSGDIGFGDLLLILSNWGPCP